jgi:hypothetical protein
MSDLSQLLDDLYDAAGADQTAPAAAVPPAAAEPAPDWSSEEALDEVFSGWVPGPSADAPAAERSFVAAATDAPAVEAPEADEWFAATEPVAAAWEPEPAAATEARELVGAVITRWSPSDDDLLPSSGSRARRGGRSRGRDRRR